MIRNRFGSRRGLLRLCSEELQWWLPGRSNSHPPLECVRRLVFICRGNICRSPLAEAVAARLGWDALSFGFDTRQGSPANTGMKLAAARLGYCLETHASTPLRGYKPAAGDFALVFELKQLQELSERLPEVPASVLGRWAFPPRAYIHDPYGTSPDYYLRCAQLIIAATTRLAAQLPSAGAPNRS